MGTERNSNRDDYACKCVDVKLNNPLMGTEIILHRNNQYYVSQYQVKLNNPLMGTEIALL